MRVSQVQERATGNDGGVHLGQGLPVLFDAVHAADAVLGEVDLRRLRPRGCGGGGVILYAMFTPGKPKPGLGLITPAADFQPATALTDAVIAELAAALRQRGWQVAANVGQSHFRCDLTVCRPNDRAYRLAILVDTDAYYQRQEILERDVLKPRLLRAFGWKVAHVLTKDWCENPDGVLQSLERCILAEDPEDKLTDELAQEPARPTLAVAETAATSEETAPPLPVPAVAASIDHVAFQGSRRRFEFVGSGSSKFWEVTVVGFQHTVRFGRIGTAGQTKTKMFGDAAAAERDARRLINEKLSKGYLEKDSTAAPESRR